jgi:DNA polymerase-3 subunit beta
MKLTIERAALHEALQRVGRSVATRTTIPILACVRLQTADGASRLDLTATDLDLTARRSVVAEVAQGGGVCLSSSHLSEIVARLPAGAQIALEASEGRATIRSGRARFVLPTLPAEDFPQAASEPPTHTIRIAPAALLALIGGAAECISQEETRYYLGGIYFHAPDEGRLRAVATDGHRLARIDAEAEGAAGMPGVIVPRKAVIEIRRLAEKADREIVIALGARGVELLFPDGVSLTSRLIDGTFPDYARVIPAGADKRLTVDREAFRVAVERVAAISSERGRAVRLDVEAGKVALSVRNPDSGDAADEIEADYEGAPITLGFNAKYLTGLLDTLAAERVTLELTDPNAPTILRASGGGDALMVLMPLRV